MLPACLAADWPRGAVVCGGRLRRERESNDSLHIGISGEHWCGIGFSRSPACRQPAIPESPASSQRRSPACRQPAILEEVPPSMRASAAWGKAAVAEWVTSPARRSPTAGTQPVSSFRSPPLRDQLSLSTRIPAPKTEAGLHMMPSNSTMSASTNTDRGKTTRRRKNSWSTPRSAGARLAALALQTREHSGHSAVDDKTVRLGHFEA